MAVEAAVTAASGAANDSCGTSRRSFFHDEILLGLRRGAIGTGARYLPSGWVLARLGTSFPCGTLAVNVMGSFLLGALMHLSLATAAVSPALRAVLAIGVMGGSTTYGTAIVERVRSGGFAGATVFQGIGGFGARSVFHTAHLLPLSEDLPIVIEIVDSEEHVERLLPILDEMVGEGLVTLEKVRVV